MARKSPTSELTPRSTCPVCFKVEEDDRENCVSREVQMCPNPVPCDDRMLEVRCAAPCGGDCGKHLAIPIGNVMKRRQLANLGVCAFDVCRARVVQMPSMKGTTAPPPIAEAPGGEG